jgi:RHS repeat-associated protein
VGTSSARPDNLDDFATRFRAISRELEHAGATLISLYNAFLGENEWGHFDAGSLLGGYRRYSGENEFDAAWVQTIANAFRRAGAGHGIARLPDAAIKASLRGAGLDRDRRSVTFDDPVAYGFPPTTGYTNDPVNTATGNFVAREVDLACGGLADALTFARTYNSRSDHAGPFGRGWASWASLRLVARPDGARYTGPDGQEALFPRLGSGYDRVIGVEAHVVPLDGGLELHWLDGRRWTFDDAGVPVGFTRGPGTAVRLHHDGGRLALLEHRAGKWVRLEWDDDRVAALECSDGRRVSYRYDERRNLVAAQGSTPSRSYQLDELGRIASIVDADGVAEVVNEYDDEGRVLAQRSPFGRRTQIAYLPGRVTVTLDDEDGPANTYVHDGAGRLLRLVDGAERELSLTYDTRGSTVSSTERNGATTVQEHDDRGRPVRRVLPTGAELSFAYDGDGRVVEIAVSGGAVTRFAYAGDERSPEQITDPEGGVTRLTVRDGLVHRLVDPDGVALEFEFDADGNPVAATDADGNRGAVERDGAGRVTATITPLGRRTQIAYDARGHVSERRDPDGAIWHFEHTAGGRLASVTDPTGARVQRRYGEHGDVTGVVDALGNATVLDYDTLGNVVATIGPGDTRWEYAYDALMRLTATVDPAGGRWEREYDAAGTLVGRVDPTGVRVSATLDAFGRVTGMSDGLTSERVDLDALGRTIATHYPDASSTRMEYDRCNRCTLVADATGAITHWEYTAAGRVARVQRPSGRAETFEYDACGRIAARIDGAGRRTELRYDADGEVVEVQLPTGEVERIAFDDAGRARSAYVPGAGETTCAYDAAGRVIALTDRASGRRRFEYDDAGRLVAAMDANGATTRFEYDERGLATRIVDPLGAVTTRRHDAAGRTVEQTDPLGRTATIAYDGAGRVLEQHDPSGRTVGRAYDASGRIVSFGAPDAAPVAIEYDALGMPVAIEEPGAFANRLRWDAEGRLVERIRGDLAMHWTYDGDGERTAIGYPDGSETAYTFDAGGYVVAAQHPALGTVELERDDAGRLVGARGDGMHATWRYEGGDLAEYELRAGDRQRRTTLRLRDGAGRVAVATIDGEKHGFAYDAAGQLVATNGPEGHRTFHYDACGRLVRELTPAGDVAYAYDVAGQLVARTGPGGEVTRYEYDGGGRRVLEVDAGGLQRRYRWDELGRLSEIERGGEQDPLRVAVDALGELAAVDGTALMWDTAHPLAPLTWSGADAVIGEGAPWALAGDGAARWLAPDWQGTIGDERRDPWGAAPSRGVGGVAGVPGPRLGYRGELELDGETWLRHRVYRPASRSFQQPDPLLPVAGSASSANPYAYAANNPLGWADPLGLRPVTDSELDAIRDRMDRNLLEKAADFPVDAVKHIGTFVYDNAGLLSAITGTLALIPPLTPFLAPVSIGLGIVAVGHSFIHHEYGNMAFDIAAIVPGVGAAMRATRAEASMARAVQASVHARWLGQTGRMAPDVAASATSSATRRYVAAADLKASAHPLERIAAGTAVTGVVVSTLGEHEEEEPNPLEYREPPLRPVRRLIPAPAHP